MCEIQLTVIKSIQMLQKYVMQDIDKLKYRVIFLK